MKAALSPLPASFSAFIFLCILFALCHLLALGAFRQIPTPYAVKKDSAFILGLSCIWLLKHLFLVCLFYFYCTLNEVNTHVLLILNEYSTCYLGNK